MNEENSTPQPKGARRQTKSYVTSTLPPAPIQSAPKYTTHPIVIIGVALMATLTMATIYFWLAIWLFGRINPPDVSTYGILLMSDFLTAARVVLALIVTAILTAFTWSIGNLLVDE